MIPTITLAMIVRNEEQELAACLDSVRGVVDEIVIVDTGSTDNTKDVAQHYTDKVFDYTWDHDFSAARNFAITKSLGQWILVLDADERLDTQGGQLRDVIAANSGAEAIFLPLRCPYETILSAEYQHFLVMRLFLNHESYRFTGKIHEQVLLPCQESVHVAQYPVIWHKPSPVKLRNSKRRRNIGLLRQALAKDQENLYIQYYLAVEWLGFGRFAMAAALLKNVCCKLPEAAVLFRAPAITNLILCLRYQGKLEEALKICAAECRRYPEYTDLFFSAGVILEQQQDYDQAIKWFEAAIAKETPPAMFSHMQGAGSFLAFYHIGCCCEATGCKQQAVNWYERTLSANPEFEQALYRLFFLKLSELGLGVLAYFQARPYYQTIERSGMLGRLFLAAGLPAAAAKCYKKHVLTLQECESQISSMVFGGEFSQALALIHDWQGEKTELSLKVKSCQVLAYLLNDDEKNAKQLALAMWRVQTQRSTAYALLLLWSRFTSRPSVILPEHTREPACVNTLLWILDACLCFTPDHRDAQYLADRYFVLAQAAMDCLTAMSAQSHIALGAYWADKRRICHKRLAYFYAEAISLVNSENC